MVLHGQLAVGALDFRIAGGAGDAKYLVVIAFSVGSQDSQTSPKKLSASASFQVSSLHLDTIFVFYQAGDTKRELVVQPCNLVMTSNFLPPSPWKDAATGL
jgi:hypothetical protein